MMRLLVPVWASCVAAAPLSARARAGAVRRRSAARRQRRAEHSNRTFAFEFDAPGGRRLVAWQVDNFPRAASILGADASCAGAPGATCAVACDPPHGFGCEAAAAACRDREWCVGFSRPISRGGPSHEGTLKRAHAFEGAEAAPAWWAAGAARCAALRGEAVAAALAGAGPRAVRAWARDRCDALAEAWVPPAPGAPLVFDVGLAGGEDAELFLRRGYRVVAVEANPAAAAAARAENPTLRRALDDGALTLVERAVVEDASATPNATLRVPLCVANDRRNAPSSKTSNLSISVKSKSFRLIFGRIVFSRRVLLRQRKNCVKTV